MQSRASNSQSRLILIGCLAILLITGVLYFMKRLEANSLIAELSATKGEKREREEDLNGKLTGYVQKIEEMTKQLGSAQSRLDSCENGKDSLQLEVETAKDAVDKCLTQQQQHLKLQGNMEDELNTLRDECNNVKDKAKSHLSQVSQLQQAAKNSEFELDSCQTIATQCQNQVSGLQAELVQAKAHCNQQYQQLSMQSTRRVVNDPRVSNSVNNPGIISHPKLPSNQFQNPSQVRKDRLIQQQQELTESEEKEKDPSYPEEENDEDGNSLNDKPDDLFEKEEENDLGEAKENPNVY